MNIEQQITNYENAAEFIKKMFYIVDPQLYEMLYSTFRQSLTKKFVSQIKNKEDEYSQGEYEEIQKRINKVVNNFNMIACEPNADMGYVCFTLPKYKFIPIEWNDYIANYQEFLANDGVIDPYKDTAPCLWKYRDISPQNFLKTLNINKDAYKHIYAKNEFYKTSCLSQTPMGRVILDIIKELNDSDYSTDSLPHIPKKEFCKRFMDNNLELL